MRSVGRLLCILMSPLLNWHMLALSSGEHEDQLQRHTSDTECPPSSYLLSLFSLRCFLIGTTFKVFTEFVTTLLLFYVFWYFLATGHVGS